MTGPAGEEEWLRPLVGRSRELALLREAIAPGRVVTVLGPPGVGKTRLARELSQELAWSGSAPELHGVFCDSVEAESAEDLCTLVGRACDVDIASCASSEDAARTIGRALSAREGALLVLDNFEQLVPYASVVSEWTTRGTAIVATSRHKLGLAQETTLSLAPLSVASASGDPSQSDAVTLFLDHYLANNPDHCLLPAEVTTALQIVRSLEGLPLAIVLSAARLRPPLSAPAAEPIDEARSSLARAIGQSWDRLSAAEREVLAQCSVFRGGFDESAASAVVELTANEAPAENVASILRAIVEKSLLTSGVPADGGPPRYAALVSIREFAGGRLDQSGRAAAAELRHATYFGALALRAQGLESAEGAAQRARLTTEIENLLAAHRRASDQAKHSTQAASAALQVALGLALVSGAGAPLAKTLSLLDASVATASDSLDQALGAQAMLARSRLLDQMGRSAEALASARVALEMARELPEAQGVLLAASGEAVGRSLLGLGRWREAREGLSQAMNAFRSLGLREGAARAMVAIGDTWFYEDDLREAQNTYARALDEAQSAGASAVLGIATLRVAIVEMELGRSEGALRRYAQAIEHMRAAGDRAGEASAATYLGILEQDLGLLDVARARFETLMVTTRELGNRRGQGTVTLYLGAALVEAGELPEAVSTLELAEQIHAELGIAAAETYARGWRAAAVARQGDIAQAKMLLDRVRGALRAMKEQSFYISAAELFAGHVELAQAERAELAGDVLAAAAYRAEAERRLAAAPAPEETQSDVRIARRVLARALGVSRTSRPPPAAVPEDGERALVVDKTGAWFRAPLGKPVDIAKRLPLRKLLAMLVEARLERPGRPIPGAELILAIWGRGDPAVLQNRLRVAVATLRKLGLATHLFTRSGGYLLDPGHPVLPAG